MLNIHPLLQAQNSAHNKAINWMRDYANVQIIQNTIIGSMRTSYCKR